MRGLSCLLPRKSKDGKLYLGESSFQRSVLPLCTVCVSDFHKVRNQSREDLSLRLHLRRQVPRTRSCYTRTRHGTPTRRKGSNTATHPTDLLPPFLRHPLPPNQPQPWTSTRKGAPPLPPQSPKSVPNPRTAPNKQRRNPRPEGPDCWGSPGIF